MRAKEEIRKRISRITIDGELTKQQRNEFIEIAMNEYARLIAEKAVEDLVQDEDWADMDTLDKLISRIKTLTEE